MRPGKWVMILEDNVVGEILHVGMGGWLKVDVNGAVIECDHFEVVLLD